MRLRLVNAPPDASPREPAPVRISVAMMVGSEAHFIEDAIKSAAWADEIVVLDTGSTDGTYCIAADLGAKVVREPWRTEDLGDGLRSIVDFGAARTRSIELASGDWVVLLDADERFDCPDLREILETMPECVDVAAMRLEHEGRPELAQDMTRIFRRSAEPRYEHRIHETLDTWIKGRCHATLPVEAGRVVHLGGARDTRAKHRRDERDWKLIQRSLADDQNDLHALAYAVEMLSEAGHGETAETLARHAYSIAAPDTPSRHRVVLALCDFAWKRSDVGAVLAVLDDAAKRWAPDANCIAARGLALWLAGRHAEAHGPLVAALNLAPEMSVVMLEQVERALMEIPDAAE